MASRAEAIASTLGRVLSGRLVRLGLAALLALLLYGIVPGNQVIALLILVVAARGAILAREALHAGDEGGSHVRRSRREIGCEALGVVAFVLLIPFDLMLYSSDLVTIRCGQSWVGVAAALGCVALYAWPHRWPPGETRAERRELWWGLPSLPALVLGLAGIAIYHPYLDPTRSDRLQLEADRVLSLRDIVEAGADADAVFAYAAVLAEQGETSRAIEYYRRGLRLAPQNAREHARLRALEQLLPAAPAAAPRRPDPRPFAQTLSPDAFARRPFWTADEWPASPARCRLDPTLEEVAAMTVVIVPVGDVPGTIETAIADVVTRELGLPTCIAEPIALPTATRFRGVVFGAQWSTGSLVDALLAVSDPLPKAPLRFVLVTGADIYDGDANFLFSSTYAWGAVVSYARFERFGSAEQTLEHRAAKQALGALVKSFGVPTSADPNCVTSYSNGLEQFDAKGNRPDAESFALFLQRLAFEDREWRARRSRALSAR